MNHECPSMGLIHKSNNHHAVITQDLEQFTLSLSNGNDVLSIQIHNCPFCGERLGSSKHKNPSWVTGTY